MNRITQFFKRKWNTYPIYKIRKLPYADYVFIDGLTLLVILTIVGLNVLLFAPHPLVLNIPSVKTQKEIVESLLRTLSIFFGITFSFIVLSFNIFYRHFGRYVFLCKSSA